MVDLKKTTIAILSLLIIFCMLFSLTACNKNNASTKGNNSSETSSVVSSTNSESTESSNNISGTTDEDTVSSTVTDVNSNKGTSSNDSSSQNKNPSTNSLTSSNGSSSGNTTVANKDKDEVVIVQRADPDTGISWDGKSPIIYTYSDGTTGTEKRAGATYEQLPGVIGTVYGCYRCGDVNCPSDETCPKYTPPDNHCSHCGKVMGYGLNGTCTRWFWDQECPNCHMIVPARTCHTCG